jgi:glycerol-3-phosphate dehydrogenase
MVPSLRRDALVGAVRYWDAQVDDARHTMELARTAASYGATVLTSTRVIDLLREGERVVGTQVRDQESGEEIDVAARQVINATGVWADEIQEMAGRGRIRVRASKGIHLVVPKDRIHSDSGLILRTETSVLFVIPWGRHWLIGTTDTDWDLGLSHPAASAKRHPVPAGPGQHGAAHPADPRGRRGGLRGPASAAARRVRGDQQAVTRARGGPDGRRTDHGRRREVHHLPRHGPRRGRRRGATCPSASRAASPTAPRCSAPTATTRCGTAGTAWPRTRGCTSPGSSTCSAATAPDPRGAGLLADRPELGERISGADTYLKVEAVYAASHEGALHLDDLLTRRTRISIETFDRGIQAAHDVAPLMGEVLGWDEEALARELEHYEARVAAELESQRMPDDRTADAARLGARDVRMGAPG